MLLHVHDMLKKAAVTALHVQNRRLRHDGHIPVKELSRPQYQPDTHVLSEESHHQMGPIQVGCVVSPREILF